MSKETINSLNKLIRTCIDGENGYREAAEEATSQDLKTFFLKMSQQRAGFRGDLQAEVTRLGGDPEDDGTLQAAIHRAWIDIRDAISGKDDESIVEECKRGDTIAVDNYEDEIKELPANLQEIAQNQLNHIRQAADELRRLDDQM